MVQLMSLVKIEMYCTYVIVFVTTGLASALVSFFCLGKKGKVVNEYFSMTKWTVHPGSDCILQPCSLGSKPAPAVIPHDPRKCAAAVRGCGFFYLTTVRRPTTVKSHHRAIQIWGGVCLCVWCVRWRWGWQPGNSLRCHPALYHSNGKWELPYVLAWF